MVTALKAGGIELAFNGEVDVRKDADVPDRLSIAERAKNGVVEGWAGGGTGSVSVSGSEPELGSGLSTVCNF
jgi:hypothetical protein